MVTREFTTTPSIKIATWNVRSLLQDGKIHNLNLEAERLKIDILGVSECRLKGTGDINLEKRFLIYSGNDNESVNGVGLLIKKELKSSITNIARISDRIIMISVKTKHTILNIIQVYAPTSSHSNEECDELYNEVKKLLKITKKEDVSIVMGDFNAKVGAGSVDGVVGNYGLGSRNERGDKLIEFCIDQNQVITNTWFKLPARRLYTWKHPADSSERILRNQIDFIMINHRYRNAIKKVQTYPGADVDSDHNILVAEMKITPKKVQKSNKNIKQLPSKALEDIQFRNNIQNTLNEKVRRINPMMSQDSTPNEDWEMLKKPMIETLQEINSKYSHEAKKEWMTKEILELMEEKRKWKNKCNIKHNQLKNLIRNKIRAAKEKFLSNQCKEIELYEKKHDLFRLHKKVKEITSKRKNNHGLLKDKYGNILTSGSDRLKRWKEYVLELFNDVRSEVTEYQTAEGPSILEEEVRAIIEKSKDRLATGPDSIPNELYKLLDDEGVKLLTKLFNKIYNSGIIPVEWLKSTFVTLPKKSKASLCSDYRTISLMSHALKLLLKIIHTRIYKKIEEDISNTQFGFRDAMGTREALFTFNTLVQRCYDSNVKLYACFIDKEKAFDKVRHDKLMEILKSKNIDTKDIRLIENLYWNQEAEVRTEDGVSETIRILRGVRQGCILSPLLFNLYAEVIFNEVLSELNVGVKVNGVLINNIRFADDAVLMTTDLKDLEELVNKLNNKCSDFGIKINIHKTKFMVFENNSEITSNETLKIESISLTKEIKVKYLGTWIVKEADNKTEIKSRIEQARQAFTSMQKLMCNRDLSIEIKKRMLNCYVWSVLLYGAETWTITKAELDKIKAFEMWCYRRILRISWTDRITNVEVLNRMNTQMIIENKIKERKLLYLGHIMRGEKYALLRLVMQGKIQGKKRRGRKRISWLKNLTNWYGISTIELFRAAMDKKKLQLMTTNLRIGEEL
jgi:hypothetical protein